MLSFSTEDLRVQDRFDHWCEVRGKGLFGITIELERERRAAFHGRFVAREFGGAVVSEMQASSYRLSRTEADIAHRPGQSLCIGLQVRGPGWLETGRGPIQSIGARELTIAHSDMPFHGVPAHWGSFEYQMLKIPISGANLRDARTHDLHAAKLPPSAPAARALAALFGAVMRGDHLRDPEAEVADAARLALIARGRLPAGCPEGRAALRAGLLHAARDILVRDMALPKLAPSRVAAELGISLRQVHVLFEPTGRSFARTLTDIRLEAARRLLRDAPGLPVISIIYACGFESLSAFYRAFQAAYGLTPGEVRRERSLPAGTAAGAREQPRQPII